jgi:peptidyl-prolyl cis-trans isomerase SurA
MTKIKAPLIIVLVASLMLGTLGGTAMAEVVDRIVAVVNNDIITMSELDDMTKAIEAQSGIKPTSRDVKEMQRKMLETLIDRKLALAEAKRRGLKVSPKEVDEAVEEFKKNNNIPDDATLLKALSNAGLTFKEFKKNMANQMLQERLVAMVVGTKVTVSNAEVRRVYDEKFKHNGSSELHLVTLSLPFPPGATEAQKEEVKQKAAAILSDVKGGVPFRQAAGKFSLSLVDAGYVSQRDLDPRLADYLKSLKPKEVAPVETLNGYQLIQLVNRRAGEARPFEEVAPQIRRMLQQREMAKYFHDWVKTLRQRAHIKIML